MTEIIDSTGEEIGTDVVHVEQPPTALFKTDDPVEVIEKATQVANALKGVLKAQGLTQSIQGKDHVRVEGWQLVGAMLGVTAICTHTEPVDGGFKATVEARMADGRIVGRADAVCTKHEKRGPWKTADDYARLSMAQTRATSKAFKGPLGFVVSLAGFQSTPAEEMTFVPAEPEQPVERIDPEIAADVGLHVTEAMQAGIEDKRIGLIFSAAGAEAVSRDAIAALTRKQAEEISTALTAEIAKAKS